MEDKKEKVLHRAIVQMTDGISVIAQTGHDVTEEEARDAFSNTINIHQIDENNFHKIIVMPITTKHRWEEHTINFCPRCGKNITESHYYRHGRIRCMECDIVADIDIHKPEEVE